MPLYVKHSDQAGKIGQFIFNSVGTNFHIKKELINRKWVTNILIPHQFNFLGIDVDFEKNGIIIEVQFSNYPFLLNNLLRSELFYKSKTVFNNKPVETLIIISKAHMFPAPNSTLYYLYYEQAMKQLNELIKNNVFDIPIRLVGLFENEQVATPAIWTEYSSNRYSRSVVKEHNIMCKFVRASNEKGRYSIIQI